MEHRRPDNKNNGTQPHHLTKKKNQARYLRKNIILQGKKQKNTFKMHTWNIVMVRIIIDHFC